MGTWQRLHQKISAIQWKIDGHSIPIRSVDSNSAAPIYFIFHSLSPAEMSATQHSAQRVNKNHTHPLKREKVSFFFHLWFKNGNIFKESQHYRAMGAGFQRNFAFHSDYAHLIHRHIQTHSRPPFTSVAFGEKEKKL